MVYKWSFNGLIMVYKWSMNGFINGPIMVYKGLHIVHKRFHNAIIMVT